MDLCVLYIFDYNADIGGRVLFMKKNIPCSSRKFIFLRMTYINCLIVKSFGTKYLFLSIS